MASDTSTEPMHRGAMHGIAPQCCRALWGSVFAECALQGWHRSKLTSGKGRGLHANLQCTSSSRGPATHQHCQHQPKRPHTPTTHQWSHTLRMVCTAWLTQALAAASALSCCEAQYPASREPSVAWVQADSTPGTTARGWEGKCTLASTAARAEFCIPTCHNTTTQIHIYRDILGHAECGPCDPGTPQCGSCYALLGSMHFDHALYSC